MSLLLTEKERKRFADWLAHEARTDAGMIELLEKDGSPVSLAIAKQRKVEIMAAKVIENKLRSMENVTL